MLISDPKQIDMLAYMFVRALVLNTNPIENKAHEVSPCPVVIWEDNYNLDNHVLKGAYERKYSKHRNTTHKANNNNTY